MKTPTFCYCHLYREYAELFSRHKDGSRHYQKGNLVNTLLNQQTIYHYVLRGTVSLSMITENGYRKMLLICGPGMIFPIFRDGADYRTNYTIQFQAMETVETHFLYESHLSQLGIVKTGRGYLQILDVPRLQEFCSSDVLDESLSP